MSDEQATFVERRQRFMEALGDGIAVIPGAQETARNSDVLHEFRQSSDFFFLTGFDEPVRACDCAWGIAPTPG